MGEKKDKVERGQQQLIEENPKQEENAISEESPSLDKAPKQKDSFESENGRDKNIVAAMGYSLIRLLQRIPGVNRLPLHRMGPRRTAIGALLLTILIGGTIALMVANAGDTFAGEKSDPMLILTFKEKKWEIDLQKLGYDGEEISTVDQQKLLKQIEKIKEEVDQPRIDAKMEKLGQPIKPSQQGQQLDVEKIKKEWLPKLETYINKPQKLPVVIEEPLVTEEDLKQVGAKRIGSYVTYYNPGNVNRTTNLRLASEAIHDKVLSPGEVFSFNETVGERTVERGYRPATVIVSGEYSEGVGGGICQISSTLYNSVDNAGLKVVARQRHSKAVDYVPVGRDAAVAWGVIDFKFENTLSKPILIKTHMDNGKLTIQIYSTPDGEGQSNKSIPSAPKQSEQKTIQVDPGRTVSPGTSTPPRENNTNPPSSPGESSNDGNEDQGDNESSDDENNG